MTLNDPHPTLQQQHPVENNQQQPHIQNLNFTEIQHQRQGPQFLKSLTQDPQFAEDPPKENSLPPIGVQGEDPEEAEEKSEPQLGMSLSTPSRPVSDTHVVTIAAKGASFRRGQKRKRMNRKQLEAVKHKVHSLMGNLKLIPFVPNRALDFASHESLLRRLGLWEFVHVELDSSDLRADLIAQLVVNYKKVGTGRVSEVNGFRIKVSRADLGRALKLPPVKKEYHSVIMVVDEDAEFVSEKSIHFVEELMSNWMLLHDEDTWILPEEVMHWIELIRKGHPDRVEWASLMWFMVEKELSQGLHLVDCYYASHLQHLIKHQNERLFLAEPVEDVYVREEEEEEDGGDVVIVEEGAKHVAVAVREEGADEKMAFTVSNESDTEKMGIAVNEECDEEKMAFTVSNESDTEKMGNNVNEECADEKMAFTVSNESDAEKMGITANKECADEKMAFTVSNECDAEKMGITVNEECDDEKMAFTVSNESDAEKMGNSVNEECADEKMAFTVSNEIDAEKMGISVDEECADEKISEELLSFKDNDSNNDTHMKESSDIKIDESTEFMEMHNDYSEVKPEESRVELTLGQDNFEQDNIEKDIGQADDVMDFDNLGVRDSDNWQLNEKNAEGEPFLQQCNLGRDKGSFDVEGGVEDLMEEEEEEEGEGEEDVDGAEDVEGEEDMEEEDVEEEEYHHDDEAGEEVGIDITEKFDSLQGISSAHIFQGVDISQSAFGSPLPVINEFPMQHFGSHAEANSTAFGSTVKRAANVEQNLSLRAVTDGNKRIRYDDTWDNQEPSDFYRCMENIEHWMGKAKMMYAAKEQESTQMNMNQQHLYAEVEQRNRVIEHQEKTAIEVRQKSQMEIYKLERELFVMGGLLDSYRKALKETRRQFAEYRAQCSFSEEPLYKDAGPSGLVLSVAELERQRLKQEVEDRMKRLELENTIKSFEAEWYPVFEGHHNDVQKLDEKLLLMEEKVKLLRGSLQSLKAEEIVEQLAITEDMMEQPAITEEIVAQPAVTAEISEQLVIREEIMELPAIAED